VGEHKPVDMLHFDESLKALRERGLTMHIIGEDSPGTDLFSRVEPGSRDGEVQTFENKGKYLKAIKNGEAATAQANSESKDLVGVKKWKVFSEIEASDLQAEANKLASELKAKDPHGRYLIVTDYNPEMKFIYNER